MQNVSSSGKQPNPAKKKFNASLSFPYLPPFTSLFAERVPVLQAFQLAIANYVRLSASNSQLGMKARVLQFFGHPAFMFRGVECGVFTGSSLVACACLARDAGIDFRLFGLDTFSGLPPLSEKDQEFAPEGAIYRKQQMFADTSIGLVETRLREAGVRARVALVPGLFSETLTQLENTKYHFVNIDCDLYDPHRECLEYFYPRMVRGGVVFFDDYHSVDYPMAGKAIDDFMRNKPETLIHLRFGADAPNRTKAYFVKY